MEPLSYPIRGGYYGHYTEEGHKLVASTVLKVVTSGEIKLISI